MWSILSQIQTKYKTTSMPSKNVDVEYEDSSTVFGQNSNQVDFSSFGTEDLDINELDNFLSGNPEDVEKGVEKPTKKEKPDGEEVEEEKKPTLKLPTPPDTSDLDEFLAGEEEQETEEDSAEKTEDKKVESNNIFEDLAGDLIDLGVFSQEEGEEPITTPEQLLEKFNKEKQKGAGIVLEQYLSRFGQKYRDAFQSIFQDGIDPEVYFTRHAQIESFEGLDMEDESNRERVLRAFYKKQGFSESRITKKISGLKDLGQFEEESVEAHEILLEAEKQELEQELENQRQEQIQKQAAKDFHKNSVISILQDKFKAKEFDGIPITEKVFNESLDYMVTDKYRLPNGETLSEFEKDILDLKRPENFELRVKLALLMKGKLDLTKVKSTAVSQTNNQLFNKLTQKNRITNRNNPTNNLDS